MKLGVLVQLDNDSVEERFSQVKELGLDRFQLSIWKGELLCREVADKVNAACEKLGITVTTLWCGWSGPTAWNFTEGPQVLGLVPPEYREARIRDLMAGSDFAKMIGVNRIATHAGFLPENPSDPAYGEVVGAIRQVAEYYKANGQYFLFETGQETPVTLLRTITDVGLDNLGINLDPANLILYGKANPIDALDVFGRYVMEVHAKDGCYPTDGRELGVETRIGEGRVDFPAFVKKLRQVGFDGNLIIEREIFGDEQTRDIKEAIAFLTSLI